MRFTPKKSIKRFQQGGPMAPEDQMPAEEPGMEETQGGTPEATEPQNPLIMLAEGAVQALQNQDCQIAMQVCQGLIQILQQAQSSAPQEAAEKPVFKKGGVLLRRVRK